MKKIKSIMLWVTFSFFSQLAIAAQDGTKPLQIGDQVPDLKFVNTLNSPKEVINLSDYRGKLVILDFFATWCLPCIKALPKMDSLQQVYKDQVVILPITLEKEGTVHEFLRIHPELKMTLPYLYATDLRD